MSATASSLNCFVSEKARESKWKKEGCAEYVLRAKLEDLYWEGVKNELEVILRTLERLQNSEAKYFKLWEEMEKSAETVSGYETFVDQVCPRSRDFAKQYGKLRSLCEKELELSVEDKVSFTKLAEKTWQESGDLKREIQRAAVLGREKDKELTPVEHLARVLLRSAGFLDVEKIVEHRPPLDKLSFWKRPAVPQLTARRVKGQPAPRFKPRTCSDCGKVIHGCMFAKRDPPGQDRSPKSRYLSCENCYRHQPGHYGNRKFFKMYKHCILEEAIDPETSLEMCRCGPLPGVSEMRVPISLYPVRPEEHEPSCTLLALTRDVAQAKQNFLRGYKGRSRTAKFKKWTTMVRPPVERSKTRENKKETKEELKDIIEDKSDEEVDTDAKSIYLTSETGILDAEEAEKDIPRRVRRYTRRYPFGNVHMALRVGPIVIENGVPNTKGGALISVRQPSRFLQAVKMPQQPRSLAVAGKAPRNLYSNAAEETSSAPKRAKAVLKQVVGTPFTGLSDQDDEGRILKLLVEASTKGSFANPAYSAMEQRSLLDEALGPLYKALKKLMERRVQVYLDFLSERLLSPDTKLRWNRRNNNCQNFCDVLLSKGPFAPLFAETNFRQPDPLYLISFICRPEAYPGKAAKTKLDVPHGLTEEYLFKFHFGLHEESDIIDTLQEYWHDFGGFGKHLYRFQDLFPWDCTEAFSRNPVTCSDCSLSKHVWAFPFDSWSIISLHFRRDRCLYPPKPTSNADLSDADWIRTRLSLLQAEGHLAAGAAAMASKQATRQALQEQLDPSEPQEDRRRLGGIHRAQPWSHCYEGGQYRIHFIAEWAHLGEEAQVAWYELLRGYRTDMPDLGVPPPGASLAGSRYESVRPGTFGTRPNRLLGFEAQMGFVAASFDRPREAGSDAPARDNGAGEPTPCGSAGGDLDEGGARRDDKGEVRLDSDGQDSDEGTSTAAHFYEGDNADRGGETAGSLSGTEAGRIVSQYYQQQSHNDDRGRSVSDMHSTNVPRETGGSWRDHSSSHGGGGRRWDDHYRTGHSFGDKDRSRHDHSSSHSYGGGGSGGGGGGGSSGGGGGSSGGGGGKSRHDHSSSHNNGGGGGSSGGGGGGHYSSSDTGGYSGGGGGGSSSW